MTHYLLRRFCAMIFILLCVSMITFSLMHFVPGCPAEIIAEEKYGENVTTETVERVRREMGLDRPIFVQYFRWIAGVFRGDFGYSFSTSRPVWNELMTRLPATAELALAAMLVSLIIAIPVGIISAVKQYSIMDSASMVGAMLGVSMPNFWLGLLLILVFSVNFGWLPVYGRGEITQLILPALTLGTGMAAVTARLTRSSILEILKQDYIRTARSKGLVETAVINRHALKNALIPVVTVVGLQFGALLEGAVVVEVIFAWPGLGRLLVDSIFARDFPVIQGCVFVIAVMYVIVNLLIDISYAWLDPRIRYEVK
ncbi:MAG: Glutathione transport system permease protein GsiC [Syntrophomonadaceae bacterium]|nr:Glutathione transport system permease protein GsiC [Bacillota bacterium]MBT9146720.1 Glutathione transport system permease protein GsiC [Bacillota bacterium]